MNFDLGGDELALRDGIRELCAKRFPMERIRRGFDRDVFAELGEAGVFSLRLPTSGGGLGLGMTEAGIVFQELGRALVPGPLVATHLAAGIVDGASTGERIVGVATGELIEYADELDVVIGWAGDRLHVGPAPRTDAIQPLDPLTPVGRRASSLDGAPCDADAGSVYRDGVTLTAALASGVATRTTELAVSYAKEREQFDKPIGAFQAVKHICSDMFVRAEVARAAVDAAGVLIDSGDPHASRAAHASKLLACEYALANAKACVQVYGGMGFTWEVDAHLYLKRAAVLASQFGGIDQQAELVAATL